MHYCDEILNTLIFKKLVKRFCYSKTNKNSFHMVNQIRKIYIHR